MVWENDDLQRQEIHEHVQVQEQEEEEERRSREGLNIEGLYPPWEGGVDEKEVTKEVNELEEEGRAWKQQEETQSQGVTSPSTKNFVFNSTLKVVSQNSFDWTEDSNNKFKIVVILLRDQNSEGWSCCLAFDFLSSSRTMTFTVRAIISMRILAFFFCVCV